MTFLPSHKGQANPYDDPLFISQLIRKNPDRLAPFLSYLVGLDMDSEEYLQHKHRMFSGQCIQSGYFRALYDISEYWRRHEEQIKGLKLNNYNGVKFLLKKFIERKRDFFEYGDEINLIITSEELDELNKPKKRGK